MKNIHKNFRLGKRMKTALEYLGEAYIVKQIDGEDCIYRNLGNGYDIEVSGIVHPRRGYTGRAGICNFVCVWDISRQIYSEAAKTTIGSCSVEYVRYPRSLFELKQILDALCLKYGQARTQ